MQLTSVLKEENHSSDLGMLSGVLPDILCVDIEDRFEFKQAISSSSNLKNELNVNDEVPYGYHNDDIIEFKKSLGIRGSLGALETSIASVPPLGLVASDTKKIRTMRTLVLKYPPCLDVWTFANEITQSSCCNLFKVVYDKISDQQHDRFWFLKIYFSSSIAAQQAECKVRQLNNCVSVSYGDISFETGLSVNERMVMLDDEMKPWINLILIVKNFGTPSESCRMKLEQLFPNADVVLHKASGSEILTGIASLVFGNTNEVEAAISSFQREPVKLDGRQLILLRFNGLQLLPNGMLRLGERFLVVRAMRQIEDQFKGLALPYSHATLCDILARDTRARRECGFPAPSYNNMKGLYDVRSYSEVEQGQVWKRLITDKEVVLELLALNKTAAESNGFIDRDTQRRVTKKLADESLCRNGTSLIHSNGRQERAALCRNSDCMASRNQRDTEDDPGRFYRGRKRYRPLTTVVSQPYRKRSRLHGFSELESPDKKRSYVEDSLRPDFRVVLLPERSTTDRSSLAFNVCYPLLETGRYHGDFSYQDASTCLLGSRESPRYSTSSQVGTNPMMRHQCGYPSLSAPFTREVALRSSSATGVVGGSINGWKRPFGEGGSLLKCGISRNVQSGYSFLDVNPNCREQIYDTGINVLLRDLELYQKGRQEIRQKSVNDLIDHVASQLLTYNDTLMQNNMEREPLRATATVLPHSKVPQYPYSW